MTKERREHTRSKLRVPNRTRSELRPCNQQGRRAPVAEGGSLIRGPIPLEAGSGLELRIDLGEFRLAPVAESEKRS